MRCTRHAHVAWTRQAACSDRVHAQARRRRCACLHNRETNTTQGAAHAASTPVRAWMMDQGRKCGRKCGRKARKQEPSGTPTTAGRYQVTKHARDKKRKGIGREKG
eukprot:366113-Chlamydomonas_euryale.AAC.20